uniref:DUF4218 domain-containing protein n=1 Tax=Cannabis sativa TaxID=3483 RepID=A0A803P428_CANSA
MYYEPRKIFNKLELAYESVHVCQCNYCLIFNDNASKESCPACRSSRWVTSENSTRKKVPCKVMQTFPLTPRLKRLYKLTIIAKSMIWHHTGKSKDDGMMRHPVNGVAWKDFDAKHPEFASDPRNVQLGLAADEFNAFDNMSLAYSMWPVVLANYNLPPCYARWLGIYEVDEPFERYLKRLNNYVENKARPKGSIAEGYVADEEDNDDNEDETNVDVVHDLNSSNFVLMFDLGELILQSDEPDVIVEHNNQPMDVERENNEFDKDYIAQEIDDLLVQLVQDENKNLVNDGNDSDSSLQL